MNIERHERRNNGHSSDELGLQNLGDPLRFRLGQSCDEIVASSTAAQFVRKLLQRINDLTARIECLEDRLPALQFTEPAFNTDVEPDLTQDVCDDLDNVARAEPSPDVQDVGGLRLAGLPRGPLPIDVVAKALGKTVRTLRGWSQVEKYEIPAHKEAGQWRFYKDELIVWSADYEAFSRRDAKRAQAKRRKTKHGK